MDENEGWFADVVRPGCWVPCAQVGGCCLPLDVEFDNEAGCDDFIRTKLVGLKCLDD